MPEDGFGASILMPLVASGYIELTSGLAGCGDGTGAAGAVGAAGATGASAGLAGWEACISATKEADGWMEGF